MKQALRNFLLVILTLSGAIQAFAQPSEAEIRKQLTNEGTKSIRFSGQGTRQWNKDVGNWEWVRGVEVIRKSEYAGIDLVVVGDVVYQYTGAGKYVYWKFRTLSNQYLGIPNPTAKEIEDFISQDWQKFYGFYYTTITKVHLGPVLADKPDWIWHNPNSVEFRMKLRFDHITSNTEIQTLDCIWKVRLYRDAPKSPWKNMVALRSEDAADLQVVNKQNYTPSQIGEWRKKTLAFSMAEEQSRKEAASLPAIAVPEFRAAEDMAKFIHNILRNGDEKQFRAAMMKLMAPGFFLEGSQTQLRPEIEQALKAIVTAAYQDRATYQLLYCQQAPFRVEKWGDGNRKTIYVPAAVDNCTSTFIIGNVNLGYKEGVAQTGLRLLEFDIRVRQDNDAINYVRSFSDRKNMCKAD